MGAAMPCSEPGGPCCAKQDQELHGFPSKGEPRAPGLKLEAPIAVADPSRRNVVDSRPAAERGKDATSPPPPVEDGPEQALDLTVLPPADDSEEDDEDAALEAERLMASFAMGEDEAAASPEFWAGPPAPRLGSGWGEAEAEADFVLSAPRPEQTHPSIQPMTVPETMPPTIIEQSEADKGLVVRFRMTDGVEKDVEFGRRKPPMGLDFAKSLPIPVYRVHAGGHAEELGVKEGWHVIAINGQNTEDKTFMEVMTMLAQAAAKAAGVTNVGPRHHMAKKKAAAEGGAAGAAGTAGAAAAKAGAKAKAGPASATTSRASGGGLTLGFKLPDGSARTVAFGDRKPPMGMDFEKTTPVRTLRVKAGGHSEELGIKPGWTVVSVNGTSTEARSPLDVLRLMKAATA